MTTTKTFQLQMYDSDTGEWKTIETFQEKGEAFDVFSNSIYKCRLIEMDVQVHVVHVVTKEGE